LEAVSPGREVLEVLCSRGVVRRYAAEKVDETCIGRMLDAAVAAPTAANKQAWAFVVVRSERRIRLLQAFAPGVLTVPPVLVVACFDRSRAIRNTEGGWDEGLLCVGMAVENLLLAAHALGLGGCPVGSFRGQALSRILALPEHVEPLLLVPFGWPVDPVKSPVRRSRSEVVHDESWGTADGARERVG
jgi:nitroreductase